MGIRKKSVVGTLGLRIRTRGDTMSGVKNGTITVVEVVIGDGSGRKWAGIGRGGGGRAAVVGGCGGGSCSCASVVRGGVEGPGGGGISSKIVNGG
ncbi:hypothetical protein Tco_1267550 [Tanacetum coccineum]